MTTTAIRLPALVWGSTAERGPNVRIKPLIMANREPVVTGATNRDLLFVSAMRELAALSFDTDSLDRESDVDIWGFHGAE